jgi:MerR family transcriptional regulator, light-induced transcriptional regulator
VEYPNELRSSGHDPAQETYYPARPQPTVQKPSPNPGNLADDLLEALVHFNEPAALEVTRRAFALYSVDQVLLEVVQPTLVRLGEAWHRGELPIAVEHYATQFCMQYLMSMLAASAPPSQPGTIVAACAPGELHQVGLLILVVMLRWRGWDVKYLGPDLPLERLEEALNPLLPQALLFSANRIETAARLAGLADIIARFPSPRPPVIVGGQAFQSYRLPANAPVIYLTGTPTEVVQQLEDIMHGINTTVNSSIEPDSETSLEN